MKLIELFLDPNKMASKGYGVDYGKNAYVFSHPNKNYAIKVFKINDGCYLKFIELCIKEKNDHFPKIYKIIKSKKLSNVPEYIVVMEKLQKVEAEEFAKQHGLIACIIELWGNMNHEKALKNAIDEKLVILNGDEQLERVVNKKYQKLNLSEYGHQIAEQFKTEQPDFYKALILIHNIASGCFPDIKSSNIMKRGTTYIISDPLGSPL